MIREHENTLRAMLLSIQESSIGPGRDAPEALWEDIHVWERTLRRILEEVDAANLQSVEVGDVDDESAMRVQLRRKNEEIRELEYGITQAIISLERYVGQGE